MLVSSLIFIISLLILLVSARFFTVAAERLGLHLGMSPFVIGVFIVGIGTSLPELVAGVLAGFSGNSEIVSGNVLGANISNIFLILGLIAVLSRKGRECCFWSSTLFSSVRRSPLSSENPLWRTSTYEN